MKIRMFIIRMCLKSLRSSFYPVAPLCKGYEETVDNFNRDKIEDLAIANLDE